MAWSKSYATEHDGGEKDELEKKRRWVEFDEVHEHLVDGKRLAADVEQVLNLLAQENYEIVSIMPVTSGRYSWTQYSRSAPTNGVADTCASWGYSVTEGVMITSQKKK